MAFRWGSRRQGNRTLISFRFKDCIDIAEVKLLAFEFATESEASKQIHSRSLED